MAVSKLPPTVHSVRSFQSSIVSKDKKLLSTQSQLTPRATLAKRLLFPQLGPDTKASPLFSSPNLPLELDDEIYNLVAFALRAFVNPW